MRSGIPEPRPASAHDAAPRSARFFALLALVGIPGSLFTGGASAPAGIAALYGLWLRLSGRRADDDIARLFLVFGACYAALLATDILNGGGIVNFQFTAVNYLPLLAAAGVAMVLRQAAPPDRVLIAMLTAAIWLAVAISLFRSQVLGVERPGGLYMNPIPYGFVVGMWGMLLLSFALRARRHRVLLIVSAVAAAVPLVLSESKIAWLASGVGYGAVVVQWAVLERRWRSLGAAAAAAIVVATVAYQTVAYRRLAEFFAEISAFISTGDLSGISFGHRALIAELGWRAFLEGPLLGYGFRELMDVALAGADPAGPDITYLTHLHNDYLTHMVAYGYVGLAFLAVFMGTLVWLARRAADPARRAAGYGLVAMAALYMGGEILLNSEPITAPLALMIAVLTMRPPSTGPG